MRAFLGTLLESFVTSVLISTPLSFVLTAYNVGITGSFWSAYIPNTLIAITVGTVLTPMMVRVAQRITRRDRGRAQR
ncbi:MAG: hypothetical protein JWM61_3048 [Micrococcaceae bacterium]|uniref:DUF2798 domain-containing protein n=1 Tax=Arthrobacter sp. PL16 TaxID=3071720 RepID=UPI002E0C56F5|nr:hypothetical protein [Micrococcaceae bacterium]MEC5199531.1 hypothetical protein [Arthrobacter sp. PL16]